MPRAQKSHQIHEWTASKAFGCDGTKEGLVQAKHRKTFDCRSFKRSVSWTKESLKKEWSFWRKNKKLEETMKERMNAKVEEGREKGC